MDEIHVQSGLSLAKINHLIKTLTDFKLQSVFHVNLRSSIHSLKIRMTSHTCNKYEHINFPIY